MRGPAAWRATVCARVQLSETRVKSKDKKEIRPDPEILTVFVITVSVYGNQRLAESFMKDATDKNDDTPQKTCFKIVCKNPLSMYGVYLHIPVCGFG